jgi:hypothetical protein
MQSVNSVGNTFYNNLMVAPATLSQNYYTKSQYLHINSTDIKYTSSNNLAIPYVKDAQFVDALAGNYLIQTTSPAVEKGKVLSHFRTDLNNNNRPHGSYFDIGAYELSSSTSVSNNAPSVSAGSDKTVTLPTSSLTLTGTASDADGSIASKTWTKVSGPSCTMSGTTSLNLSLSGLLQGTYTFRLTVKDNVGATKYDDVLVTVKTATTSTSGLLAPSSLALAYNSYYKSATLTWRDNSSNESGFEIFMSIGNTTSYKQVGSTGSNATRYVKTSFTSGQRYYFKIRAKNSTSTSAFSNEVVLALDGSSTASVEEQLSQLQLYPNPAQDWAELSFGEAFSGTVSLQLLDMSGKVLLDEQVDASQQRSHRIQLTEAGLKAGLYLLRLRQGEHSQTLKLLKE